MNKKRKTITATIIICLTIVTMLPSSVLGWQSNESRSEDQLFYRPKFSTTQWLSYEAVEVFPIAKTQWITDNMLFFIHGVEAPFAVNASHMIADSLDYGDDNDSYVLYLDGAGTSVTNDSLAVRAQEEYVKLVMELSKLDANYSLAAFYAGAMTYYITQAGFWATIWDESLWGAKNTTAMYLFEDKIELGNDIARYWEQELLWEFYDYGTINNHYFDLNPAAIPEVNAWNATVDLAKTIFPVAESLGDDFNGTGNVPEWETTYYNNVKFCLESSVEAAYAALENAMTDADFKYITLPVPSYIYDQDEFQITIPEFEVTFPEFEVTFTNNTGTYILNETLATESSISYLYYDDYGNPNYLSTDTMTLSYNGGTGKWYLSESLITGAIVKTNHSIKYNFDMARAPAAYSNVSDPFFVDFYNVTVEGLNYQYHTDTQNNAVRGNLTYNDTTERWSSYNNDIGWVFTPTSVEYYVVARFLLIIPVGYYKPQFLGDPIFKPYAQQQGTNYFRTRDHQVTISRPVIEFDSETLSLEVWNITAVTDYQNIFLDEYEVREKEIFGEDIRQARWKIFLWDGISTALTGNLAWNDANQYWFVANISLADLPANSYYISALITNMNVNFTVSPWGPASENFIIEGPETSFYYMTIVYVLIGALGIPLISYGVYVLTKKQKTQLTEKDSISDKNQ